MEGQSSSSSGCFLNKQDSQPRRLTPSRELAHTRAGTTLSPQGTGLTFPMRLQGSETSLPPKPLTRPTQLIFTFQSLMP